MGIVKLISKVICSGIVVKLSINCLLLEICSDFILEELNIFVIINIRTFNVAQFLCSHH